VRGFGPEKQADLPSFGCFNKNSRFFYYQLPPKAFASDGPGYSPGFSKSTRYPLQSGRTECNGVNL
jgi:hypothetical protein